MPGRVLLVCHASTLATRRGAFPVDEPLDRRGVEAATSAPRIRRTDVAWRGPTLRCEQTAELLGITAAVDECLDDWNMGAWRGRTLTDLAAEEPELVERWLGASGTTVAGGESLDQLLARVGGWLDGLAGSGVRAVAVTHSAVIRAAVVHAIGANPESFWRIDIAPLARIFLSESNHRWTLRAPSGG